MKRRVLIWLRNQETEMTFTEWKQQAMEKFQIKNPLATKILKAMESAMILTMIDKKKRLFLAAPSSRELVKE